MKLALFETRVFNGKLICTSVEEGGATHVCALSREQLEQDRVQAWIKEMEENAERVETLGSTALKLGDLQITETKTKDGMVFFRCAHVSGSTHAFALTKDQLAKQPLVRWICADPEVCGLIGSGWIATMMREANKKNFDGWWKDRIAAAKQKGKLRTP